mmetsp:Transcript_4934/g.12681  ORF Transcript_4934/g.12681 Transcript_4934/m.12681 type:complete len:172 (+) Transcript_4934:120-635(+)
MRIYSERPTHTSKSLSSRTTFFGECRDGCVIVCGRISHRIIHVWRSKDQSWTSRSTHQPHRADAASHFSPTVQSTTSDKDYGYQKSSVKRGELNPVWDEYFEFNNIPTLNNMVLTFQVYDSDVGSRDDKCGWCKIKLEHEDITDRPKRFTKTIDFNLIRRNGTITVEVSYE